jgi:MFS family permease
MAHKDRTDLDVPLSRYNFVLNVLNGALSFAGGRAADLGTVVPLLVLRLVGAEWAVGLSAAVQEVARVGTQFFASRLLDARERKRPSYIFWSVIRVFALSVATAALMTGVGRKPWIVLGVLLASLFLLMVGNGVAELTWSDITARSVPSHRRGTLSTLRRVLGLGLSLLFAAPLVNYFLSPRSPYGFPANYGALFLLNTVLSAAAWAAFSFTREPAPHAARRRLSFSQHIRRGIRFVRRDSAYRRLLRIRFIMGIAGAVAIFFIAFGKVTLGLPDRYAAMFLTFRMASEMVSAVIMGRISDRIGNRTVIRIATWLAVATFSCATASAWTAHVAGTEHGAPAISVSLLSLSFFLLGFMAPGREMGEFNYMLDIAPAPKRPSYIGFGNAFLLPLCLLPIGVGTLAPRTGYLPLFAAATVVSVIAIYFTRHLQEPRENAERGMRNDELRVAVGVCHVAAEASLPLSAPPLDT